MLWKEGQSPRVKRERKPSLRGKWESVFSGRHMDNVPEETHVVSVMTHRPCKQWQWSETENPSRKFWHPPMCLNCKSEKGCMYGDKFHFRHVEAEGKPSKKSKKGGAEGSDAILKESIQLGCVSQDSYPRKSILREEGRLWPKHTVKFSKSTWHPIFFFFKKNGKERVHREELSESVRLMSVVLARPNSVKNHMRRPCTTKMRPQSSAWFGENIYKLKNSYRTTFFSPIEAKLMPAPTSTKPGEREIVVDSGASMHMMSKKVLSSVLLSQDSLRREAEQAPRELVQPASSSSSSSVSERSDELASRRLVPFPKVQNQNKKGVTGRIRKIRQQIFLTGYGISQKIWKKQNCMYPHTVLRNQIEHPPKVATKSRKHSIYAHFPKDRNCDVCLRAKIARVPRRRRTGEALARAEKFGDLITADHKVLNEGCESRDNHQYAVVVQGLATQWIQSYPCKTKSSHETERSLSKFLEPSHKPRVEKKDNLMAFGKACEGSSWNHRTLTPHQSETNGMDERWWSDSMECYCYLRNIQDLLGDGKTPCERRFGEPFKDPIIPFGALIEYHPVSPKDQARIHQLGKKVFPGIFLGCEPVVGGIWKRDSDSRPERFGRVWCIRRSSSKNQHERSFDQTNRYCFLSPSCRWFSKIVRKRQRIPRIPSKAGTNCEERRFQQRISWWTGRVSHAVQKTIEHHESGCIAGKHIQEEFQNNVQLYSGTSWIRETTSGVFAVQTPWRSHVQVKGFTSMSHFNLVHKLIPMPLAMNSSDAKAAVDKEWKKLDTIPAWQLEKVKSKKEVILEAQRNKKKVHFATLIDICRLKNVELKPKLQKYQGKVVLREDIVKDDCGAYAVFTEQGSSASQMIAEKVMMLSQDYQVVTDEQLMQHLPTLRWNGRMHPNCPKFLKRNVEMIGYVFHDANKIPWCFSNETCAVTH